MNNIKLKYKYISSIAYIYIALPLLFFTTSWIKTELAILSSLLILMGLFSAIRDCSKNEKSITVSIISLIVILTFSVFWVYTAGIGGGYPQMADWHWRNAIMRDLMNFSWPIIYPETGQGLVYYLTFFLIPSAVGKILGEEWMNAALFLWTVFGIFLTFILISFYLQASRLKKILIIILIFIVWREFDDIRYAFNTIFNATYRYEYTNNDALVQWVTNQAIVPWVATLLFLNDRNIRNYAFNGFIVFASAPFPFIGLFILLVSDGISQLIKKYKNFKSWISDVCSLANLTSLMGIFLIFAFYFIANSAASGDYGHGGIGLYLDKSFSGYISLFSFFIFNVISIFYLLYQDYKKDFCFYIVFISLLFIPIIRIGDGLDFCSRASIPAMCVMCVYVIKYIFYHSNNVNIKYFILIGSIGIFTNSFICKTLYRTSEVVHIENKLNLKKDSVYSLSIRLPYTQTYGSYLNMYLTDKPYKKAFYKFLSKGKSEYDIKKDIETTYRFLKHNGFIFISGKYNICNFCSNSIYDIVISDTTIHGKYEIYFNNRRLFASDIGNRLKVAQFGGIDTKWASNDIDIRQLFSIVKNGEFYKIIWNNNYALSYKDKKLYFVPISDDASQLWIIKKVHVNLD